MAKRETAATQGGAVAAAPPGQGLARLQRVLDLLLLDLLVYPAAACAGACCLLQEAHVRHVHWGDVMHWVCLHD